MTSTSVWVLSEGLIARSYGLPCRWMYKIKIPQLCFAFRLWWNTRGSSELSGYCSGTVSKYLDIII